MIKISNELVRFIRPSAHSKYSPSSMDRIIACPFSVEFTKNHPNESSVYSIEGSVAHSLCEYSFYNSLFDTPIPTDILMDVAKYDQAEMFECASGYTNVLNHWLNSSIVGDILHYGLEVGIPMYPEEGMFGTADCLMVGTKACVVIDYKHGKGKNVAADSLQLRTYLAGVFLHLEDIPTDYQFISVVYQPRTDMDAKEHYYNPDDMFEHAAILASAIKTSKQKDLIPCEGSHCYWCPGNRAKTADLKCPALKQKTIKLAEENFAGFLADMNAPVDDAKAVNVRRDEALIKLITLYPMIKKVAEDGMEEFEMRLEAGEQIPGVIITSSVGKREINGANEAEKMLSVSQVAPLNYVMTKTIPATTKMKTMTEIEKELGKGALDPICTKKITKKVEVMDDKMRSILGEMLAYSKTITSPVE